MTTMWLAHGILAYGCHTNRDRQKLKIELHIINKPVKPVILNV